MNIKVAITDDHPVVTSGLTKILSDFPHITVVAVFPTGTSLLQNISTRLPDVLLLDMNLPDIEGPEIARQVLKTYPDIKILVLSSSDILIQVKKMLQLGCKGYILKDSDDLTIVKAIETIYNGGQYLTPALQERIVDNLFKNKNEKRSLELTRREKEVLKLILDEHTNTEIAAKLFISSHTVENHRISLLHKLNVKNTAGLVKKAIENGLIPDS